MMIDSSCKNRIPSADKLLAFRSSWKGTLTDLLILAASGAYFTLAFPGIGFSLAAWTGIIPLVWLCASRTPKRAFVYGFVWGYFWNLTACFFLREIMFFIPFLFAVILGLFSACFASVIPFLFHWILYPKDIRNGGIQTRERFYRFSPLSEIFCALALAGWWTALEWIRSWIATGFPWNLAAASQWKNLPLIQICEYTGVYGVSFLVAFMNFAAYFGLRGLRFSIPEGRYKRPWAFLFAVTLCLFISWLGTRMIYSRTKNTTGQKSRYFTVGVVQPQLSQRRHGGYDSAREALSMCTDLSRKLLDEDRFCRSGAAAEAAALAGTSAQDLRRSFSLDAMKEVLPLDLIVWPESAVPVSYYGGSEVSSLYRKNVEQMLRQYSVPFLIGTLTVDNIRSETEFDIFNSALLLKNKVNKTGYPAFQDMADVYSKVHLVPYGEFIPLSRYFPRLGEWVGMGRDLTPGHAFHPVEPVKGVRAGILICYEDVFSYAAGEQAKAGANILLVITNDAWYPTSFEPEQHYANSIFRAIETRLPMIRCGNSNYSVLIDSVGRTADSVFKIPDPDGGAFLPDPGRTGKGTAKFLVPLPGKTELTFYTRYGNLFVLLCWLLFGAAFLKAALAKFEFRKLFGASFQEKENKMKQDFLNAMKK